MSIRVSDLSFNYGEKELLNNANFTVEKNQKVGLVGENGTGKEAMSLVIWTTKWMGIFLYLAMVGLFVLSR